MNLTKLKLSPLFQNRISNFISFFLLNTLLVFFYQLEVNAQAYPKDDAFSNLELEIRKIKMEHSKEVKFFENRILELSTKVENLNFELRLLNDKLEKLKYSSTGNESTSENSSYDPRGQSVSRCSANTKKGTRCSRNARSNGFCWQHGG